MRVIAGKARRIQLKTVDSMATRPTTDRIKETLFNMISVDLYGSDFLDLFSGSGAIGIEALSRGAKSAVFVENSRQAISCIRDNLVRARLADQATVMQMDCQSALISLKTKNTHFDYIFMDPPYNQLFEKQVLALLKDAAYVDETTLIIVEASLETDFDYLASYGFMPVKIKKYKTNQHVFVKRVMEK